MVLESDTTSMRPAGARRRLTAFGVDVLILAALFFLVGTLPGLTIEWGIGWDRLGSWGEPILMVFSFGLPVAFMVSREMRGRSIGHRALKLSVRDVHGIPAPRRRLLHRALIKYALALVTFPFVIAIAFQSPRTVARPVDRFLIQALMLLVLLVLGMSIASFVLLLLYFGRSLHDYLAGTVVHEPGPARGTGFEVLPSKQRLAQ
jgi:uncharacterized RDD family membrane protein YckC